MSLFCSFHFERFFKIKTETKVANVAPPIPAAISFPSLASQIEPIKPIHASAKPKNIPIIRSTKINVFTRCDSLRLASASRSVC